MTIPFAKALETVAPGVWTVDGKTFEVKSSDATFTNLTADVGTWNKDFEANVADYELLVDDATTTVNFTPQAAEGSTITATYEKSDKPADKVTMVVQNGKANAVTLGEKAATGQTVTFTVIAPDQKSSKEYVVKITKADVNANNDATLEKLTGTGLPTFQFDQAKTEYNVKVKEIVDSITFVKDDETAANTSLKASDNDGATIFVNGEEFTESKEVDLAHGKNTIEIKVLAADNKTEKVYTVNVERAAKDASEDATLGSFTVSEGTLKDFKPGEAAPTEGLTLDVANAVQELTIVPVASSPKAKVEVKADTTSGGNADLKVVADGNGYKVTGLAEGETNKVTVTVTSEDAKKVETYTLTIKRAAATASDIAQLKTVTVETLTDFAEDFKATKEEYNYNVAKGVKELNFTNVMAAADGKVEYKVNGDNWKAVASNTFNAPLKVGANTIQIKVLAADNKTERTYTIKVNRASENASDVATLSNILLSDNVKLEGFTADKKAEGQTITASIPSDVKDLTFTPQTTDANASVKVEAKAGATELKVVQKGGSFTVENLPAGAATDVTITVTPENADATAAQKYTITVNKAAANANDNAFASEIKVDDTKVAGFAKDKYEYTTSVPFATNATKLSVKPEDKTATVKVNGKTVAVSTAEDTTKGIATTAELPLAVGDNKFTIEVTSANGKVTKTYTVNVKRTAETASNNAGLTALTVDQGTLVVKDGLKAEVNDSEKNAEEDNKSTATLKLASDVKDITFTATPAVEGAKVELLPTPTTGDENKGKVTGMTVANVADGDSYDLVVTSPDTNVTYTTTITIEKASENASAIADLTELTVTPRKPNDKGELEEVTGVKEFKFDEDKTAFDYYVTNKTTTIEVEAEPKESISVTYEFNGEAVTAEEVAELPLKVGKNEVKVTSLAADNKTSKEYTITVYRASASDSPETELTSFKDLTNKVDEVKFETEAVTVPAENDAFKFSLPTLPAGATAKVTAATTTGDPATEVKVVESNGVYTTAGIPADGATITIEVTAADKATVETYTIKVTVAVAP